MDGNQEDIKKAYKIDFDVPMFVQYVEPMGFLTKAVACHALWYYYVHAAKVVEQRNKLVLEGEADFVKDVRNNCENLMRAAAFQYMVKPEEMVHYWPNVDMQCHALDLPKLPDNLRFKNKPVIITTN